MSVRSVSGHAVSGRAVAESSVPRIVVIGGGFAGALAAIKIMDRTGGPLDLAVVESRDALGRGIAYSTPDPDHIVNGPAHTFSLYPERPGHFAEWLAGNAHRRGWAPPAGTAPGQSFPPRLLYGDYVEDELARARADAQGCVGFVHVRDRAVDVVPAGDGLVVRLASGHALDADKVVLATGLFASDRTIEIDPALRADRRYLPDVYAEGAFDGIASTGDVLMLGTSLTAVDALITLEKRGYRGTYTFVSRRGLVVPRRSEAEPWPAFLDPEALPTRITDLVRIVQRERRAIAAAGEDWQRLPPALRPFVTRLWIGADDAERRRFVRHARVYWDVCVHRAAAPTAGWLARVEAEGRCRFLKGRIVSLAGEDGRVRATIRRRGAAAAETIIADRAINGLGHEFDWNRIADPLVRSLVARALVQPNPNGFGILADPATGAVLDRGARASGRLYAVGHPLRGVAWEASAIPEQVAGATAVAASLDRALFPSRSVA